MYWEAVKLIVVDKIFLNSNFHLEALIFIGTSYGVFFFFFVSFEIKYSLFLIFEKMLNTKSSNLYI